MTTISNDHIAITLDLGIGISVRMIRDVETGQKFLRDPSMLFDYAVDDGVDQPSDTSLVYQSQVELADIGGVEARYRALRVPLAVAIRLEPDPVEPVIIVTLRVTNTDRLDHKLRTTLPKIRGMIVPGDPAAMMGAVPSELGSVSPLAFGGTLGRPVDPALGLPTSMNMMELASLYNGDGLGGVFFADVDGDLDNGVLPLAFNLSAEEVAGHWAADLRSGATVQLPRLAIGVHHDGDWRHAVDYYTATHRPRWRMPRVPEWLREAGAIYSFSGGGAGAMYLSLPGVTLADGAVWTTWEKGDGAWRDGDPHGEPLQVSTGGFAPAGAHLAAAQQGAAQLDVFAVNDDGAVWATWATSDRPWHTGRHGLFPVRVSPPGMAPPGAPLATISTRQDELGVLFVDHQGRVVLTRERGDGAWTDGADGRWPRALSPSDFAPAGAHLAVAEQSPGQWSVFAVARDGAIWVTSSAGGDVWMDGRGGRVPLRVTPPGLAPPGAPLAAAHQSPDQLDVFVVGYDGAVWVTWERNQSAWRDGRDRRWPAPVTPLGLAPPGAHLATLRRLADQLDVYVVGYDGAVSVTWQRGDGVWRDASTRPPQMVTGSGLAPPGAPLAAVAQSDTQSNVFVVGHDGALWTSFVIGDGAWTDGRDGRAAPMRISTGGLAPPNAGIAVHRRNPQQLDAFFIGRGRIRSFRELPKLLAEAKALGTDVLYLMDYWEGSDQGGQQPYFNKGDYVPRADLGGTAAFTAGIEAVHQLGGRVILYLEPYIIYQHSDVGGDVNRGPSWEALGRHDYPDYYTMVAPFPPWQQHVVNVATRLVKLHRADGIFLDSYAWQMNLPISARAEAGTRSALNYSRGVLDLIDRVRTAIQGVRSDAVVLGETTSGPVLRHWDGGLSSDFARTDLVSFAWRANRGRLIASPVRYGIPEAVVFSNGVDINELNQIFAAGHGLALCNNWPGSFMQAFMTHIRALVGIRRRYKDALINGTQSEQPPTGNDAVIAYLYQGGQHDIMTIVNTAPTDQVARITFPYHRSSTWTDLLRDWTITASTAGPTAIPISIGPDGLRVLLRLPDVARPS